MKFSYNWLKELAKFKLSPQELADKINLHITEVESLNNKSSAYSGVIVAEILEINPHPNADKLRLATLDIGLGKKVTVVCGAPNIEVGQKVPLAMNGAKLPVGDIKPTVIRGVESQGMICSASELGLESGKSAGILVLPKQASIGRPVNEILTINDDTILDLKILSNRPDYLSYFGIARDICAVLNLAWQLPVGAEYKTASEIDINKLLKVKIESTKLCSRYLAGFATKVEVAESPSWLKDKLIASGIRPINNLVDISNLVMIETGQPVHIFDYAKVGGKQIVIRTAKDKEDLMTLDGKTRELNKDILLIADNEKPLGVAGIMGGEDSAISDLTGDIVIEVANFNPEIIRKGAKALGIPSDASLRFERNLNPRLTDLAMKRVLSLINQIIPSAVIAGSLITAGNSLPEPKTISFTRQEIIGLLGLDISAKDIVDLLTRLEFKVTNKSDNFQVVVPDFRLDITEPADITEEIVRIIGIDKVPLTMPQIILPTPEKSINFEQINLLKDELVKQGWSETPSHCFIGEDWAKKVGIKLDNNLKLFNSLNSQWTHLVNNLWPNLLQFAVVNKNQPIKIFEINRVFESIPKQTLPEEKKVVSILAGNHSDNYRLVRGLIENIVRDIPNIKLVPVIGNFEDNYINVLRVMKNNEIIGTISEVSPKVAKAIDANSGLVWAELEIDELMQYRAIYPVAFKEFSKYPASQFDISFILPNETKTGPIIDDIKKISSLIQAIDVFDVYQMPDGSRSIGLRITVQSFDSTLTSADIDGISSRVANLITTQHRGRIR